MHEIADAAGIQTGSLYHHFESKEALLVELLRRYHDDLDRVADHALHTLDDPSSRPGFAQIAALGTAIAQCAVAHRAAIQISMYETPSSNPDLITWTQRRPAAVLEAMYQTLRAGRWGGYLRSDVDLRILADRVGVLAVVDRIHIAAGRVDLANTTTLARPASIDVAKVRTMKAEGMGATEIARALKIGRASVYRALEDA